MALTPRHPLHRHLLSLLTAMSVLVLTAGCVVAGPSRSHPEQTGPLEGDVTTQRNLDVLSKAMRSYAIVDAEHEPMLDVHVFGVPGLRSLAQATEKSLLHTIDGAGGFGSHKAFDPVLTPPSHRWDRTSFTGPGTASAGQGSSDDRDPEANRVEVSNRVIAAGGNYLISALDRISPTQKTNVVLSDLSRDSTVDAGELFAEKVDARTLGTDASGALTLEGESVDDDDLSSLGKEVLASLRTPLTMPQADVRDPDFSCALLPCVALTYDDGPGETEVEDELLTDAEAAHVRLTYFLMGRNTAAHKDTAKRIAAAGHEIGNHTYSHPVLDRQSPKRVKAEVKKAERSIDAAGAGSPDLVRPPFGALNKPAAHALGHPAIIWDVDTGDWRHKDPQRTVTAVKKHARAGSIVLMHSIHPTTVAAAPKVFDTVSDKGLYPVTVSRLFEGIEFENGGSYFCRGYADELCSNPEHPSVQKN